MIGWSSSFFMADGDDGIDGIDGIVISGIAIRTFRFAPSPHA
jgi:hypothetical protein